MLLTLFCLLINMYGQKEYRIAIIPFKGVNMEDAKLKHASRYFYQKLSIEDRFQFIETEDLRTVLKEAGFEEIDPFDESGLFSAGDYLGLDLLITGIVGKGFESYNLDIKVYEISSIFVVYQKSVKFQSEGELPANLSQISSEIINESGQW